MRTAQTVLTVIQERGKQHKPIERVYRLLFNRDFYLNAYAKLYPNNGAMTKGVTDETVDGMSIQKIDRMIELLREEKYQWNHSQDLLHYLRQHPHRIKTHQLKLL